MKGEVRGGSPVSGLPAHMGGPHGMLPPHLAMQHQPHPIQGRMISKAQDPNMQQRMQVSQPHTSLIYKHLKLFM